VVGLPSLAQAMGGPLRLQYGGRGTIERSANANQNSAVPLISQQRRI